MLLGMLVSASCSAEKAPGVLRLTWSLGLESQGMVGLCPQLENHEMAGLCPELLSRLSPAPGKVL